jgi:chaperonin cofactor prefoldin
MKKINFTEDDIMAKDNEKYKNEIILTAKADLKDNELREWIEKLWTKVETLNDRTKRHTRDIQELRRFIIELKREDKTK